jgi:flavin reductase (DIM6/NTAB) family NADH-FMN oxidoreductase RutF
MELADISRSLKNLKPERVVLVISYDNKNKRASGMACGWSTICSSEPHMIAVALWKEGYTHKLIQDTKEFVVAIPNKKLEKAILIFGENHGNKVDKLKLANVKTAKAKYIRPPILTDATMNFECRLDKEVDSGDHVLFIGKVLASYENKGKKILINMGKRNGKRIFKEF